MKTLNILISDIELKKFGIKKDKWPFSDFLDLVSNELAKKKLKECVELAEKHGLSKMTMEEITEEVRAVRRQRKSVLIRTQDSRLIHDRPTPR